MFKIIPRHNINLGKEELKALIKEIIKPSFNSKKIKEFEEKFKEFINVKHSLSTSTARYALYLILKAFAFPKNSEIIIPEYSFFTTSKIVKICGLIPVFCKIDLETYNIDPEKIPEKISAKTKGIIVQHTFGQPCDMDSIVGIAKKNNLILIEDCAQALGSEYQGKKIGSIGDAGYFSFAKGKNVTTFGGGMITTNNDKLAENIRRNLVYQKKNLNQVKPILLGLIKWLLTLPLIYKIFIFPLFYLLNIFKREFLDNLFKEKEEIKKVNLTFLTSISSYQAAIGIEQLKKLNRMNKKRLENANIYNLNLKNVKIQKVNKDCKNTYNCYPLEIKNAFVLARKLLLNGIDTRVDYMSCYSDNEEMKKLPKKIIYLPNHPSLNKEDILYVCKKINKKINK